MLRLVATRTVVRPTSGLLGGLSLKCAVFTTVRHSSSSSSEAPRDVEVTPGRHPGTESSLSTETSFAESHANTDHDEESFDELEASAQELHDLTYAMISHLRKSVPDASDTRVLVQRRIRRKFRETVDLRFRSTVRQRAYDGKFNNYSTHKELEVGNAQYTEMGDKLMLLLTKDVVDRMLSNTKRLSLIERTDSLVSKQQNVIERTLATRFRTAAHYHHAPFEIQNLRSDIPESYVLHSRALRDRSTLSSLFTLMEPNHPYRQPIEKRMWEIMETPKV
mmetsp:Transcript_11437/g.13112  ORF Transcript_11437/g.13112 Transcript_11437/m.13112 type:complete len:278 (+) Transcript_11437:45-878(+)